MSDFNVTPVGTDTAVLPQSVPQTSFPEQKALDLAVIVALSLIRRTSPRERHEEQRVCPRRGPKLSGLMQQTVLWVPRPIGDVAPAVVHDAAM